VADLSDGRRASGGSDRRITQRRRLVLPSAPGLRAAKFRPLNLTVVEPLAQIRSVRPRRALRGLPRFVSPSVVRCARARRSHRLPAPCR
jgi:hypothetical protein